MYYICNIFYDFSFNFTKIMKTTAFTKKLKVKTDDENLPVINEEKVDKIEQRFFPFMLLGPHVFGD